MNKRAFISIAVAMLCRWSVHDIVGLSYSVRRKFKGFPTCTYLLVGWSDAEPVGSNDGVYIINGISVPFPLEKRMVERDGKADNTDTPNCIDDGQVRAARVCPYQVD